MSCRQIRDQLLEISDALERRRGRTWLARTEIDAHLAACRGCADFARRLSLARQALTQPASAESERALLASLASDTGFALRVLARISRPAEVLGWAAYRALPAALALALALAWLGLSQPVPPSSLVLDEPSSDQLLAWSVPAAEDLP
ncbi:MAG TPA: hypothetical protein VHR45_24165 [Thermoanaerobaculia bacterium]|nr:hypothetical protein [Thermoanaerobaculia bacterium]